MKNEFIEICKMTQKELKKYLKKQLTKNGYEVFEGDGYLYSPGSEPYLLTAHMDTVHEDKRGMPKQIKISKNKDGNTVISSPQGIGADDRAGIVAILEIIKKFHTSVLFCEDEEIGSVGCDKFVKTSHIKDLEKLNYLIQIDRRNAHDAVFYQCANDDFEEFILNNTDFETAMGSWTDICELSPVCGVASVNFSCGYYDEHTVKETLVIEELEHNVKQIEKLLCIESKQFEYIEKQNIWENYNNLYDYDDRYYDIEYKNQYGKTKFSEANGQNIYEALGKFFIENPSISYQNIIDLQEWM